MITIINLQVHFEIVGSVDNKFEVDRDSGVLRVVKPLDFEETKIYRFEIRAFNNYDGGFLFLA